ncbi:unnamed protein product, partial [Brenthis ino]
MISFRGRKRARPRTGQSSDPAAHLGAGARGTSTTRGPHCSTFQEISGAGNWKPLRINSYNFNSLLISIRDNSAPVPRRGGADADALSKKAYVVL